MSRDPWSPDSNLSKRALDNAVDVERAAVALLVDVQAGAFAGHETMERVGRSLQALAEAYRISEQRWTEHLDSFHEDKAA